MARRIARHTPHAPRTLDSVLPLAVALATGTAVALLAGCEERVGQPSPPPPQASHTVVEGAGSAPGKALESGHKLEDKVNEHNKEIEKQLEDINKN